EILGIKPRQSRERLGPAYLALARWAQSALEKETLRLAKLGIELSGSRNLVVAGGVHLNCKLNGRLRELPEVDHFFAQPVSGDAGVALGAALLARRKKALIPLTSLSLGGLVSARDVKFLLAGRGYNTGPFCPKEVAAQISKGAIVSWIQG